MSRAIVSAEIVDILQTAGLRTPDISVLSDELLAEIRKLEKKNLAAEALHKRLNGEIRSHAKTNVAERESARARMRVLVKRILRRCGYPPDLQDAVVQTVLQQTDVLLERWAAERECAETVSGLPRRRELTAQISGRIVR